MKVHFSSENIIKTNSKAFEQSSNYDSESLTWGSRVFRWYFKSAGIGLNQVSDSQLNDWSELFFSRLVAFILLAFSSPVFICVAVLIKISSRGDVFYKQVRVGKNGKIFKILKFRTMIVDAEKNTGHTLSWEGDPRITKLGSLLRKSHLDELPQLINVLKGEMVFVGPRPERPEFTCEYDKQILDYSRRHCVHPGITGLAQIALVYDAKAEHKLKFDLLYIKNRKSFILNFLIIFYTFKKMLLLKPTANLAH